MRRLILLAAAPLFFAGLFRVDYRPSPEQVVANVYAIASLLGQRSDDNDGLNANFGFVATDEGVILIDSGARRLGAEKLAATQAQFGQQQIDVLMPFLGEKLLGTRPLPATKTLTGETATLEPGGKTPELAYTDAHVPGEARV